MTTPENTKVIFAGTPEFSTHALSALLSAGYNVVAVYTQPDRPKGRGNKLAKSPVKELAELHNIPVYQPLSLRKEEAQAELKALDADVMVVVAYGLILPEAVLNAPKKVALTFMHHYYHVGEVLHLCRERLKLEMLNQVLQLCKWIKA